MSSLESDRTLQILENLNSFLEHRGEISPCDMLITDSEVEDQIQDRMSKDQKKGLFQPVRLNDVRRVNKMLEMHNRCINKGDYIVVTLETSKSRKTRILSKFSKFIGKPYYFLDFILKRILPKLKMTRVIYFWVTKGKNRVMSLSEALGRLISCGFTIIDYEKYGDLTFILGRKIDKPSYDMQPTYGSLIHLNRVGQFGKKIKVYKIRTMAPYSEYLQGYVYEKNDLKSGGKLQDDFRITHWGRVFRKLWIDEIPMIYNLIKGEMKLVGVRPLSKHYFSLYPKDMQQLRTKYKPGLLPPYYVDLPKTFEDIVESERKYLTCYQKSPIWTDVKYFVLIFNKIIFKGARSS